MTDRLPLLCAAWAVAVAVAALPAGAHAAPTSAPEGPPLVGEREQVEIVHRGEASDPVMARIDTGVAYSSIDEELAEEIGLDDRRPDDYIRVRSALGRERRAVYDVTLRLAGREIRSSASIADRSELSNPVLVGRRDLDGLHVAVGRERLTTPGGPEEEASPAALLGLLPPPPTDPAALLALLPLATVLVVALRCLGGVTTFGLVSPVLLAMALVQTGFALGLMAIGLMLLGGFVARPLLTPLRLPRVARVAVLLSVVVGVLIGIGAAGDALRLELATAFPVVVTAMIVERMWELWEQEGLPAAARTSAWTVVAAVGATLVFFADPLRDLAAQRPVVLAFVAAAAAVALGSYRGLRVSELSRFRPAVGGGER